MDPRLQRVAHWFSTNAWLVAGLVLLVEAAFQYWLSASYWPRFEECEPGFCSRQTQVRVESSLLFAQTIAAMGSFLVFLSLVRFLPAFAHLSPVARNANRWIWSVILCGLGTFLTILVAVGGVGGCPSEGCGPEGDSLALDLQHVGFGILLILVGLNLLPRPRPRAQEAPPADP